MRSSGMTIREAAERWVHEMNAFPYDMIEKLMNADIDSWHEVTKPSICDRVYVYFDRDGSGDGEIVGIKEEDGEKVYQIELDNGKTVEAHDGEFEVERDSWLPMWGTLWAMSDPCDIWWLENGGIEIMSECGFRVYQSDDFGYFFGIDGAGYSFYEAHWIPLYKARGLQWHDTTEGGEEHA